MFLPHVANVTEPVVDQTQVMVFAGCFHAPAAVMTTNDYVLHLENGNRILDYAETIEVGVNNDIGNVSMYKDFAGGQTDNLICRHAAVRTADPEILGALFLTEFLKELWIVLCHFIGPQSIILE